MSVLYEIASPGFKQRRIPGLHYTQKEHPWGLVYWFIEDGFMIIEDRSDLIEVKAHNSSNKNVMYVMHTIGDEIDAFCIWPHNKIRKYPKALKPGDICPNCGWVQI